MDGCNTGFLLGPGLFSRAMLHVTWMHLKLAKKPWCNFHHCVTLITRIGTPPPWKLTWNLNITPLWKGTSFEPTLHSWVQNVILFQGVGAIYFGWLCLVSNHLGIVDGDVALLCHDKSSLNHQFGTYVYISQTIFSRLKSLNNHTSTLPETNSKFHLKEAGS